MKKLAFIALIALLSVSCSKEQRINRKIDGEWKLKMYNGGGVSDGLIETYTFSKDKKGKGIGVYKYVYGNTNSSIPFDYYITNDDISLKYDQGSSVYTVELKDKNNLMLTDSKGNLSEFEKQ